MAIPPTAVVWTETMAPYEFLDFGVDCSALLEGGEMITEFSLTRGPESVLLGLQIDNKQLIKDRIHMWLSIVNPVDVAFVAPGVSLPIEVRVRTSQNRVWTRTVVIKVSQK